MHFLDKLLLGKNLPDYSETAMYPSQTLKRTRCLKKHCTDQCKKGTDEWEFWAFFLSEKEVSRSLLIKKIRELNDDLRISVWYKLSGARKCRFVLKNDFKMSQSDRKVVDFILKLCRDRSCDDVLVEDGYERIIFYVYRNIIDIFYGDRPSNGPDVLSPKKSDEIISNNDKKSEQSKNNSDGITSISSNKSEIKSNKSSSVKTEDPKKGSKKEFKKDDKKEPKKDTNNNTEKDEIGSKKAESIKNSAKSSTNSANLTSHDVKDESDPDIYEINGIITENEEFSKNSKTSYNKFTKEYVDEDLIVLIDYILRMEYSNANLAFKIVYILFSRMGFDTIYLSNIEVNCDLTRHISTDFYKICQKKTKFMFLKKVISMLIANDKKTINCLLDVSMCFSPSAFMEILGFLTKDVENKILDEIKKEGENKKNRKENKNIVKNNQNENKKDQEDEPDIKNNKDKRNNEKDGSKDEKKSNDKKDVYEKINLKEEKNTKKDLKDSRKTKKKKKDLNTKIGTILYHHIQENLNERLEDIKKHLKTQKIDALEIELKNDNNDEEYFDFLVVQNEVARAQESLKETIINKMEVLSKENQELIIKNKNLKENLNNMEIEMKEFQDNMLNGIKEVLNETKKKCDELENENLKLKEKQIRATNSKRNAHI